MTFPIDATVEWTRRARLLILLNTDPIMRAALQVHYKNNCIDWINDWCVTYDPRVRPPIPKLMPMVLFQRQRELVQFLIECLRDKENGLIEKSRDMGASWICCCVSLWLYLYHDGSAVGWGSSVVDKVDKKGDMSALFPKMRKIIEYLPRWMLPPGFVMDKHATYLKITSPVGESSITGESGDNIGRGGRTTMYLKDESSHYERPELIEASLGDNTDVQIDISSVNGSANVFYRRRMAGEVWMPNKQIAPGITRVFIMDWHDHPGKTQEWYDRRKTRAEAEGMLHVFKQEVDRDYSGSVDRIIIRMEWINASVDAHKVLGFAAEGEKVAANDVADGGGDKNALTIRHGVVLNFAEDWGGEAGDAPVHAIPICIEHGAQELYYDAVGVGSGYKTTINYMQEHGSMPPGLRVMPWNGGSAVLDPTEYIIPGDDNSPTNADFFENLKAQAYWRLRTRFYKTWRAVTLGEKYDPAELISLSPEIKCLHQLKMELAQPVHTYSKAGKTMVKKTPDGAKSPNLADSAAMNYSPTREISILDAL